MSKESNKLLTPISAQWTRHLEYDEPGIYSLNGHQIFNDNHRFEQTFNGEEDYTTHELNNVDIQELTRIGRRCDITYDNNNIVTVKYFGVPKDLLPHYIKNIVDNDTTGQKCFPYTGPQSTNIFTPRIAPGQLWRWTLGTRMWQHVTETGRVENELHNVSHVYIDDLFTVIAVNDPGPFKGPNSTAWSWYVVLLRGTLYWFRYDWFQSSELKCDVT